MPERKQYKRRHRLRFRNARKLKLFLLALGMTGLGLGILLIGYRFFGGHRGLGMLGLIYLFGASSILAARQGMIAWEADRKRRRASSKGVVEDARSVPADSKSSMRPGEA